MTSILTKLQPTIQNLKYQQITCIGGTIAPFDTFLRIFPCSMKFSTLQVGHVADPQNIQVRFINRVRNADIEFTMQQQSNPEVIKTLISQIIELRLT